MDGRMVKVGLMKMVDKKILAFAVGAIFVLGIYGPNVANMVQTAEAHGVQAQLQSRFIQITDESISRQSLSTGETLVLTGTLVSLVERDQRGWISLFSESTNSGNRWEIMARDPPGVVSPPPAPFSDPLLGQFSSIFRPFWGVIFDGGGGGAV